MITINRTYFPPERQPNQVIVSGPQDQVEKLRDLILKGYTPDQAGSPPLALLRELPVYVIRGRNYKAIQVGYAKPGVTGDQTDALNQAVLNAARQAGATDARTEPNCTTSVPRRDFNPWASSPSGLAGDDIAYWEGNPYDQPVAQGQTAPPPVQAVGSNPADAQALFASQDAFQRMGAAANGQRLPGLAAFQGESVVVGVFDSCPSAEQLATLPGGTPTWLKPTYATPALGGGPFVDHGLFNASLIHFIAPLADIRLYQVLGGEMFGDTVGLILALTDFLKAAEGKPAVVNLSLGSLCCCGDSMVAVRAILWEMTQRGWVVCAAAGNSGRKAHKPAAIPAAQMPAALPYVIAVAASNQQNIRATYSHRGDIAAPGGDTNGQPGPNGFDDIIGMGTTPPPGSTSPTGYVRMDCGTSFASPLVAGVAALSVGDLIKRGVSLDSGMWQRVLGQLALGAILPVGAPDTLDTTGLGAGIVQVSGRGTLPNGD